MKKRNFTTTVAIVFGIAAIALAASSQTVATKTKKKKAQIVTQLPAATTAQKKVSVDFTEENSTNVVVVQPDPLVPPKTLNQAMANSQGDVATEQKSNSNSNKLLMQSSVYPMVPATPLADESALDEKVQAPQSPAWHPPLAPSDYAQRVVVETPIENAGSPANALPTQSTTQTTVIQKETTIEVVSLPDNSPTATSETFIPREDRRVERASEGRRFIFRGSYVDAHYDHVTSDLKNGATSIGIALGYEHPAYELQYSLDLLNGLDQTVSVENTRTTIAHVDGLHRFGRSGAISGLIGVGAGLSDVALRSYRTTPSGDVILREHTRGTFLTLIPMTGARFTAGEVTVDLLVQDLILLGAGDTGALGGVTAGLSVGLPF